jgi:hypothetical protein
VRKQVVGASDIQAFDRRALLRAAAIGTVVLVPNAARAERAQKVGAVEDIRGEAFAVDQAERRVLNRAAPLFINDLVGTGANSRLTMLLGKDTTLRLGEQARLTLDRLLVNAGGEVTLQTGPILFNRPSGAAPARMQIQTSFGLIAVRGTRFFAGPSNGVFGHQYRWSWRCADHAGPLGRRTDPHGLRKRDLTPGGGADARAVANAAHIDRGRPRRDRGFARG